MGFIAVALMAGAVGYAWAYRAYQRQISPDLRVRNWLVRL